tara:strand:+ start:93 stop:446 length:354 start_codon:yes stop_codon:yes gene_type:complete
VTDNPSKLIIIGEIRELISNAGKVDNIPAISIHSPCLLVVLSPKYSFEVDHQANTGVENPIIHAGIAIIKNSRIVREFTPKANNGSMKILEIKVPEMKISHNCLTLGISSGAVLWIK